MSILLGLAGLLPIHSVTERRKKMRHSELQMQWKTSSEGLSCDGQAEINCVMMYAQSGEACCFAGEAELSDSVSQSAA